MAWNSYIGDFRSSSEAHISSSRACIRSSGQRLQSLEALEALSFSRGLAFSPSGATTLPHLNYAWFTPLQLNIIIYHYNLPDVNVDHYNLPDVYVNHYNCWNPKGRNSRQNAVDVVWLNKLSCQIIWQIETTFYYLQPERCRCGLAKKIKSNLLTNSFTFFNQNFWWLSMMWFDGWSSSFICRMDTFAFAIRTSKCAKCNNAIYMQYIG